MSILLPEVDLPKSTTIVLIQSPSECRDIANYLLKNAANPENWSVWAFDMEWSVKFERNSLQCPVGMIQFCRENSVFLFHIAKCGMQPELVEVICHPTIFKLGVNIDGDRQKLKRDFPCFARRDIQGIVDLRDLAQCVSGVYAPRSLASLVEHFLGMRLPKPSEVRLSNWDGVLTQSQIRYAALDVYISYLVYLTLMRYIYEGKPAGMDSGPSVVAHTNVPPRSLLLRFARNQSSIAVASAAAVPIDVKVELPEDAPKVALSSDAQGVDIGLNRQQKEPTVSLHNDNLWSLNISWSDIDAGAKLLASPACARLLNLVRQADKLENTYDIQPLTATRQMCYDLFMAQERSTISKIAEIRQVQEGTVLSYLSKAMETGRSYEFNRFGIPFELVQKVFDGIVIFNVIQNNVIAGSMNGLKAVQGVMEYQTSYGFCRMLKQLIPQFMAKRQDLGTSATSSFLSPNKVSSRINSPASPVMKFCVNGLSNTASCASGISTAAAVATDSDQTLNDSDAVKFGANFTDAREAASKMLMSVQKSRADIKTALAAVECAEQQLRSCKTFAGQVIDLWSTDQASGSGMGPGDMKTKRRLSESLLSCIGAGLATIEAGSHIAQKAEETASNIEAVCGHVIHILSNPRNKVGVLETGLDGINPNPKFRALEGQGAAPDRVSTANSAKSVFGESDRCPSLTSNINCPPSSISTMSAGSSPLSAATTDPSSAENDKAGKLEIAQMQVIGIHLFRVLGNNWPVDLLLAARSEASPSLKSPGRPIVEQNAVGGSDHEKDMGDLSSYLV